MIWLCTGNIFDLFLAHGSGSETLGNTVPVYIHYTGKCFGPFWMRKMILPLLGCLRSILLIITFDKLPGPDTRIKLWLRRAAAAERGSNSWEGQQQLRGAAVAERGSKSWEGQHQLRGAATAERGSSRWEGQQQLRGAAAAEKASSSWEGQQQLRGAAAALRGSSSREGQQLREGGAAADK